MKRTVVLIFVMSCLFAFVNAQVVIPSDRDQLLNGDAAGQNLIAENNGYPSAQKILDLKDQLGLMKDQIRKINEMMTNLPVSVTVKGQEIIEAEEELNKLFESGNINEKLLRAKLERIGKLRAELRFAHLQIYLKTKQILSVNQWERLKEIQTGEVK
jgi:Spy/CpxP family protein refolding chaperone